MNTVTEVALPSRLVSPDGRVIDFSVVEPLKQGPKSRQVIRREAVSMAFSEISAKYSIPRKNRRAIARDMGKHAYRVSREGNNAS
jgi:hypothetical protein